MKRVPESEAIAEPVDASRFNEVMGSNRFRQADYRRLAHRAVDMGIPPGGKVLDMGTGPGFVAIEVARLLRGTGYQVVGMDLSAAMLALAAENAAKAGLNGVLSWREGDVKAMPFDDGEFDLIVSNDSLHHWDDPLPVFDEIARVLKDDGRCIVHDSKRLQHWWPWLFVKTISLTVPRGFRVHWWNSIRSSYTADELRAILGRSRLADRGRFYGVDGCEVDMPRLVKGAKWTFGWAVVGPEREIAIPPEAWDEYGFQAGDEAIFTPGSRKSGGFGISTSVLMTEASGKMGGTNLHELGRSRFGDGWVVVPPEVGAKSGDRLLAVRGSCYGLGFVVRGPIYEEALKHPELEVFA